MTDEVTGYIGPKKKTTKKKAVTKRAVYKSAEGYDVVFNLGDEFTFCNAKVVVEKIAGNSVTIKPVE